ncbi:FliH/SctL family protein [Zhihengliuella sp. ISTPL4]|uniref:FliH/SctL family protein n=1 Tax=Zhihengliuella sp. ISTPL4 TaxID=2058657 RepID=UPI000C795D77|nr:FliH/SctL family protein [Zhihengliuella sp. ISTPL4]
MSTDAFAPTAFPRLGGDDHRAEQERARRRGYAEGHAAGFRAGTADADAARRAAEAEDAKRERARAEEVAAAVAALHAAARSLTAREAELEAAATTQVLSHAIDLAELILAAELSEAGTAAAAAARRALSATTADAVRSLRVHPDDLRVLAAETADRPAELDLVADGTLARGDAVAVLAHGVIDARVAAAFDRARRALAEGTS